MRTSPQKGHWRRIVGLTLAAACAGCWEEIRYTPTPQPVRAESTEATAETEQEPNEATSEAAPVSNPTGAPAPEASSIESPAPIDQPVSSPPEVKTASPREQLLVWRAASKWSLAAAAYAKGLETSRYEPLQQEAREAASELGLELPELPTIDDDAEREAAIIDLLRTGSGPQLADGVKERLGSQAGAASRLAVSSNLLLLVYSPQDPNVAVHAVALREAAEAADLPADLWQPLAELLESQGEYLAVRGAVFELHRQVEEHLGRL